MLKIWLLKSKTKLDFSTFKFIVDFWLYMDSPKKRSWEGRRSRRNGKREEDALVARRCRRRRGFVFADLQLPLEFWSMIATLKFVLVLWWSWSNKEVKDEWEISKFGEKCSWFEEEETRTEWEVEKCRD